MLRRVLLKSSSRCFGSHAAKHVPEQFVHDRLVSVTLLDWEGSRHIVQGRVGQTLFDACQLSGVDIVKDDSLGGGGATYSAIRTPEFTESLFGEGPASPLSHVVVSNEWFNKLPPASDRELRILEDVPEEDLTKNSRLGTEIILTKDLDGLVVAVPEAPPVETFTYKNDWEEEAPEPYTMFPKSIRDPHDAPVRTILNRVPTEDRANFPLPDGVRYFCLPDKIELRSRASYECLPSFHSFTLTGGDGSRAYGFALKTYSEEADGIAIPLVYCIISHFPLFSLFKEILGWIYHMENPTKVENTPSLLHFECDARKWLVSPRSAKQVPLNNNDFPTGVVWQDIIKDFVLEMPAPQAGATIEFYVHDRLLFGQTIYKSGLQLVDDICFQLLFQHLSIKNIVFIMNCMLLEQRILLHSSHHGLLTPVCEALCALLFPFVWEHVYIPLLPMKLIEYLQAPVPFFMGVHTSYLATKIGADVFASCVVVHLDKDKVVRPIHSGLLPHGAPPLTHQEHRIPKFPATSVAKLIAKAKSILDFHQPIANPHTAETNRIRSRRKARTSDALRVMKEDQEASEVEITFGPGPLGITFESTHLRLLATALTTEETASCASAVIKAFPQLQNGLPGPAAISGMIHPGSFLLSVNGHSTLQLSFESTCELLRTQPRPLRLRFQNASMPYSNACRFAARVQASAFLSLPPPPLPRSKWSTPVVEWIDEVRIAFAQFFIDLFHDYARHVIVDHVDHSPRFSMIKPPATSPLQLRRNSLQRRAAVAIAFNREAFLRERNQTAFYVSFFETQAFLAFINDSALSELEHLSFTSPFVELFQACCCEATEDGIHLLLRRQKAPLLITACHLPVQSQSIAIPPKTKEKLKEMPQDDIEIRAATMTILTETPAKRKSATRQLEMLICGTSSREPEMNLAVKARTRRSLSETSVFMLENELQEPLEESNQSENTSSKHFKDLQQQKKIHLFTKPIWAPWKLKSRK
ncbi:hypothetical protein THRCLA_01755 [Thraustotheca clavata]|uniref:UDENN domain-containing protein n=1 Tax=Thraustotheca clavata TaxID=74557 RepID=A0A1W0A7C6_9STRA|nr:hypothetical protein THRCLA_01755 [Thraustotheca clavata]